MNIITISREFGSGGRELGQKLAESLRYDYYDRQIITSIAKASGLNENYVENALTLHNWRTQITLNCTLTSLNSPTILQTQVGLLQEQTRVIQEIGSVGRNCVIIGRCADLLLKQYKPFSLFVCASMDAKVRRCIERTKEEESTSPKELKKQIQRIDKNRAQTRQLLSDSPWECRDERL